jgi:hypothetical protein
MLVIHVSLSRAASFLGPQHREGADALFHFGQARLSLSPGALNFVHLEPSIQQRVSQPSTLFAFQALLPLDRELSLTSYLLSHHDLRIEAPYEL